MARRSTDRTAGFAIAVWDENLIADTARDSFKRDEDFRKEVEDLGYMGGGGSITKLGWETLNEDIRRFERNALQWLRESFPSGVRDEGHDSDGDLIGTVWWNPSSKKQRELIELGERERIDSWDGSYGDFVDTAFDGCSPFAFHALGGQINFFDTHL